MNDNDENLRELFADATADIRPHGSLDDILDRSKKVDPMARRWFLPVVAAAAVIGFVIGGAVWLSNDSDSPGGPGPAGGPSGNATEGTGTVTATVPVYFVGATTQGKRLYREFQTEQVCRDADCLLEASARSAVAGTPDDPDYTNPWPAGSTVKSATYDGNVLTVDLHGPQTTADHGGIQGDPANSGGGRTSPDLAVQQLIYSAQAGLGKGRVPVQLLLDGQKVDSIMGTPAQAPLLASDGDTVLAPVQISSPGNGMTVGTGDLKVTGVASTFEANVVWELLVGGDAVVDQGHTTATECCTLSPYEFTIKDLKPGSYTLVVHDEDMSGEGRAVNQDTKEIVVQ
ncbi:MAG: Gmad2 immunoglobulin-like domain-containing protein [Marmoricola sp.]